MHKTISIRMPEETHTKLKLLSLVRKKPIGEIIDELIGAVVVPQLVMPEAPAASPPVPRQAAGNKARKKKRGF